MNNQDRKQRTKSEMRERRELMLSRVDYGLANKYADKAEPCPGRRVMPAARVSGRAQIANLDHQLQNLDYENEKLGYEFVGEFRHVGQGDKLEWWEEAFIEARELGVSHVLLETRQRVVRRASNSMFAPTQAQWDYIAGLTAKYGIGILTILEPDASSEKCNSYEKRRGHRTRGNKGGRGNKKPETVAAEVAAAKLKAASECKAKCREHYWTVIDLQTAGVSYTEIHALTGVDRMTAWRWVKRWDAGKSWPYHF